MACLKAAPATATSDAIVLKALRSLGQAYCQLDKPGTQPKDDDVMFFVDCIKGPATQLPPKAEVLRLLGKGAQGQVKDIGGTARKECVLTMQAIENGGTEMGLHEMLYAGMCVMGIAPSQLHNAVVNYRGLHVQPVLDVTELGVAVPEGECKQGLLVTMDMELMSCSLTQYCADQLHILPALHQLRYGFNAAAEYWDMVDDPGAPFGTRVVKFGPIITVFKKCSTSLKDLHKAGLIHCDTKPDNILIKLDANGNMEDCKIGDLGATCQAEADGGTLVAMLATPAYMHCAKRCVRRTHKGYNHQCFDMTELAASMLEVTLGKCSDSIQALLHNESLGDLVTGRKTVDQVTLDAAGGNSQAAAALQFCQDLQSLVHQPYGTTFHDLICLILGVWHSPAYDNWREQFDLRLLQDMDREYITSQLGTIQAGLVDQGLNPDDAQVVLSGATFPMGPGCLDKMFSKLSEEQVWDLEQLQPGSMEQYFASLSRQSARKEKAQAMVLAERKAQQLMAAACKAKAQQAVCAAVDAAMTPPPATAAACASGDVQLSSVDNSSCSGTPPVMAAAEQRVSTSSCTSSTTSSSNMSVASATGAVSHSVVKEESSTSASSGTGTTTMTEDLTAGYSCHTSRVAQGTVSTECGTPAVPAGQDYLDDVHSKGEIMLLSDSSGSLTSCTNRTSCLTSSSATDTMPADDAMLGVDMTPFTQQVPCGRLDSSDLLMSAHPSDGTAVSDTALTTSHVTGDAAADSDMHTTPASDMEQLQPDCVSAGTGGKCLELTSADSMCVHTGAQQWENFTMFGQPAVMSLDTAAADTAPNWALTAGQEQLTGCMDLSFPDEPPSWSSEGMCAGMSKDSAAGYEYQQQQDGATWSMDGCMLRDRRAASSPGAVHNCRRAIWRWSSAGLCDSDKSTSLDTCASYQPASYVSDASCATSPQSPSVQSPSSTDGTAHESSSMWKGLVGHCKNASALLAAKRKSWPGVVQGSISTEPAGKTSMDCLFYTTCMSDMEEPLLRHEADAFDYVLTASSTEKMGQKDKRGCVKHVRAAVKGACSAAGSKLMKALQLFVCGAPPAEWVLE